MRRRFTRLARLVVFSCAVLRVEGRARADEPVAPIPTPSAAPNAAPNAGSPPVTAPAAPATAPGNPPIAPSPTLEGQVAELRALVTAQREKQRELEARIEDEAQARQHEVSKWQKLRDSLQTSGFVHVDWTVFRQSSEDEVNPSTREPLNEDRFVLRRARMRFESDQGLVHGALTLDANTVRGPQVRPWNAEVSVKWPEKTRYRGPADVADNVTDEPFVMVSTGLLMTPFGYDVPELEVVRPFLERTTMSNELVPQSFDLGIRVLGGYKFVNWALGIMNGDPIGERSFPGRDPNKSKDLVFRVGTVAKLTERIRVAAGFSGITGRGFHQGNAPTKDQLVWRDQNEDGLVQQTELQTVTGSPATPSQGFSRFALGGDARVHVIFPVLGELVIRAELVRAKNLDRNVYNADPIAASRDLREFGWYLGATQELTPWAIVGVRYDLYDPDADAREQRPFALVPVDSSLSTWSFMATVRYKTAKLVAEFDQRKNALGRDASGAPTTLADDSFTLRAAVGF